MFARLPSCGSYKAGGGGCLLRKRRMMPLVGVVGATAKADNSRAINNLKTKSCKQENKGHTIYYTATRLPKARWNREICELQFRQRKKL